MYLATRNIAKVCFQLLFVFILISSSVLAEAASRDVKSSPTSREVTFSPGHVYEVTGIWVKDGKFQELNAYFGKVFPIAAKDYGVQPLFLLEVDSAYAGEFTPQIFFVNQWPSLDKFKGFVNDPRAKALFKERDALVSRLVVTQYVVPKEVTVRLADGDIVEFAAMWIRPGHEKDLKDYYGKVFPVGVKHGLSPITPLSPVYSYKGDYMPSAAGLNLWKTKSNFDSFVKEAEPLFAERDSALKRLEVTHAKVRFEGGL